MSVTTENRKRRVDTAGYLEPTELWNGKTWYDYNANRLKIYRMYSETSGAWLQESDFTWQTYRTSEVTTASGGAYAP